MNLDVKRYAFAQATNQCDFSFILYKIMYIEPIILNRNHPITVGTVTTIAEIMSHFSTVGPNLSLCLTVPFHG